jgi:hypothetical protein
VDPLGAGVVEGGVELRQGGLKLLALWGAVLDRLLTFLLEAGDAGELLALVALPGDGAFEVSPGEANLILRSADQSALAAEPGWFTRRRRPD